MKYAGKYARKYARKYAGKYAGIYARKYASKYARKYDKHDEVLILHIFGKYALPTLLMARLHASHGPGPTVAMVITSPTVNARAAGQCRSLSDSTEYTVTGPGHWQVTVSQGLKSQRPGRPGSRCRPFNSESDRTGASPFSSALALFNKFPPAGGRGMRRAPLSSAGRPAGLQVQVPGQPPAVARAGRPG